MWVLRGKVVVMVLVSAVAAAPGHGQAVNQLISSIGNDVGFGSSSNNNNNLNNNNYSNNNNLGYITNSVGYTMNRNNNNIYNNNNSGYRTNSLGYRTDNSGPQQSVSSSDQQYPNTAGYYGFYAASPDQSHGTYPPASWYRMGTAAAGETNSSPALSALALLGFLYFLNLIQDVLQNNSIGRKRRSLPLTGRDGKDIEEEEAEEGHYITSYLEKDPVKEGDGTDGEKEKEEKEETVGRSHDIEARAFSFLEDFFIKLPQALGMRKRQMVDRISKDRRPLGLSGFLASRLKMISSIMSFLQDPSPSRIRRAAQDTESDESEFGKIESESLLIPSFMSFMPLLAEVFEEYSPFNSWPPGQEHAFSQEDNFGTPAFMREWEMKEGDEDEEKDGVEEEERRGERRERRRRHSPTSMNAWYSELGGRNKEVDGGVGGVAAKAISLLGGNDVAQQAVKQEAAPALMEFSKGLTGAHPHCLQRVLCRLTSHASQLSLLPRVALQMLSSNMMDESKNAMKAGLRGENCSQTFSECDTGSKSGKTYD